MAKRTPLTPVERALQQKRRYIERLRSQCKGIQEHADWQIEQIQKRIDLAKVLITALENGTLKP